LLGGVVEGVMSEDDVGPVEGAGRH
jgi:hypothetical protein